MLRFYNLSLESKKLVISYGNIFVDCFKILVREFQYVIYLNGILPFKIVIFLVLNMIYKFYYILVILFIMLGDSASYLRFLFLSRNLLFSSRVCGP